MSLTILWIQFTTVTTVIRKTFAAKAAYAVKTFYTKLPPCIHNLYNVILQAVEFVQLRRFCSSGGTGGIAWFSTLSNWLTWSKIRKLVLNFCLFWHRISICMVILFRLNVKCNGLTERLLHQEFWGTCLLWILIICLKQTCIKWKRSNAKVKLQFRRMVKLGLTRPA